MGTFLSSIGRKNAFLSGAWVLRMQAQAACGQGSGLKGQPGENEAALRGTTEEEEK